MLEVLGECTFRASGILFQEKGIQLLRLRHILGRWSNNYPKCGSQFCFLKRDALTLNRVIEKCLVLGMSMAVRLVSWSETCNNFGQKVCLSRAKNGS